MRRRRPFVPTHRVARDLGLLGLPQGTLVRQVNPFAGDRANDHLQMLDEGDWHRGGDPWILTPADVEALPCWEEEREEMIDRIVNN